MINRLKIADDTRAPVMMAAIGPMISRLALSLLSAIDSIASAVTSAVIAIDGKHSTASWITSVERPGSAFQKLDRQNGFGLVTEGANRTVPRARR